MIDSVVIPLFVYGTLQPDGPLYELIEDAVAYPPCEGGVARGALFHVVDPQDAGPVFPVADFGQEGFVVGTLLLVRASSPRLVAVREMERGAGYDELVVEVDLPNFGKVQALAFHWSHDDHGPLIPHGDWFLELENIANQRRGKILY